MTFDEAFDVVIGHEGGYVNDPRDPGGETRYGISKRAYPTEDIANLTLDRARFLYKRDYWDRIRADEMPAAWRLPMFDTAVNMGTGTAVRMMQDALGVMVDGVIGPRTLAALQAADNRKLARFHARRVKRYSELPTFGVYWDGWLTRAFVTAMED